MPYKKIILRNEDGDKLYPRTLSTEIVDENEVSFPLQKTLSAGTGIAIASGTSTDTISANLTINGSGPSLDSGHYNWNLDSVTRVIDNTPTLNNTTHLVTSDGIFRSMVKAYTSTTDLTFSNTSSGQGSTIGNSINVAFITALSNIKSQFSNIQSLSVYLALDTAPQEMFPAYYSIPGRAEYTQNDEFTWDDRYQLFVLTPGTGMKTMADFFDYADSNYFRDAFARVTIIIKILYI